MTTTQILTLCGVPAISAALILYVVRRLHDNRKRIKALEAGVQALLRSQMISSYDKWTGRGFAPIWAKDNFQNCWRQYHSLGANGVMDGIHDEFMDLPTTKEG